jgi:GntR family transcriptional regulator
MAWDKRADRIDHDGPAFVWAQIADDLRADIESGELPPGSRLPSEQALAEDVYAVARGTIRRAVTALVEEGLLVSVHGRGTFIARQGP